MTNFGFGSFASICAPWPDVGFDHDGDQIIDPPERSKSAGAKPPEAKSSSEGAAKPSERMKGAADTALEPK